MLRWPVTRLDHAALCLGLALCLTGCQDEPPAGSMVSANKYNFRTIVVASKRPVLVEFWSPNCEPCRQLEPHLEALAKKHHELLVVQVNADENEPLTNDLGVRLFPTLLVFQDGEAKRRQVGAPQPEELADLVSAYVTPK